MHPNKIIDAIEKVRRKNNKNWMDMLRLAFKYAPDEAKKIMNRITECDSKITELLKELKFLHSIN